MNRVYELSKAKFIGNFDSQPVLLNKQIIGVVNFPPKQIATFMSECLITGFVQENGSVILAVPDKKLKNGLKLA